MKSFSLNVKPRSFTITKEFVLSCKSARSKYHIALDEKRKPEIQNTKDRKQLMVPLESFFFIYV